MLLLCLCGVIAGAESFSGIVDYGEEKLDFLRTLLPYAHGIPAHDTLNDLFRALDPDPRLMARCIRGHWGIENALHWVLDVTFDEDRCRVRKDNAPHIQAVLKRRAINLINKNKGKSSIASIRQRAGWGNDAMIRIISS